MTSWPASLKTARPPRKPAGTPPQGFGRTARIDTWWTSPLGVGFWLAVLVLYSVFSALLWTPVFGAPNEADGYLSPFYFPALPRSRPAARHLAGHPDPMDPGRLPGHVLLLPARLLPGLPRRSAGVRGGGATRPPALPDGGGAAVHPPEPPPLLPVLRRAAARDPLGRGRIDLLGTGRTTELGSAA